MVKNNNKRYLCIYVIVYVMSKTYIYPNISQTLHIYSDMTSEKSYIDGSIFRDLFIYN